jgi:hypothetical protein
MGGGGKIPKPEKVEMPDPDAERIKKEQEDRKKELERRRRGGRSISTSPMGITEKAPVLTTKLGGA